MSTENVRVGIVGCGNIADNHYQAYQQIHGVDIVAVCDVDLDRARAFAAERCIPHAVASVAELVELDLNAISVCTPHPTHEAVVTAAARAKVNVLCEKPIAADVAAAERMVAAAREAGITLGVVFQRRYWPSMQRLRRAIDDGRFGLPMLAHCQVLLHRGSEYYGAAPWRGTWVADGGGVLMTQAIHNIDLLQWFLGDPVEVSAKAGTFVHRGIIEVEDTAAALVTFASGAIATVTATVAARPNLGTRLTVTSDRGATVVLTEYPEGADALEEVWTVRGEQALTPSLAGALQPDMPVSEVNARLLRLHRRHVADFIDALRTGREPFVTGEEALKSLRIVQAVYQSTRTGLPVAIGECSVNPAFRHLDAAAQETLA
ncbi:Gfo/Idh/MocA family oxidoreductase [Streptomyces sp. RB6PN25]|uniref:Gfo/Idh/MocA family oxidoreductase n=1 Tax=Streptomyces humicola TaxID=2953240 RepID=A0ABT1PUQ1_9ACTN|nr:Gfo/Idh/MocA family oxidoreductase [Streptomyces humicola]MCQ4080873.1 Gfo/Idh/MocA family oxidoreductase [Streptomyces humicola]